MKLQQPEISLIYGIFKKSKISGTKMRIFGITMKRKGYFALLMSIIVITSCEFQSRHRESINHKIYANPVWLQGTWEQQTDDGVFSESWQKVTDSAYHGVGMFISEGDTLFSERLSIYQSRSVWYYAALVSDQNAGETIVFELTSSKDSIMVFENRNHDFPQKISYHFISEDSVVAVVEGETKEGSRKDIFSMTRKIID